MTEKRVRFQFPKHWTPEQIEKKLAELAEKYARNRGKKPKNK